MVVPSTLPIRKPWSQIHSDLPYRSMECKIIGLVGSGWKAKWMSRRRSVEVDPNHNSHLWFILHSEADMDKLLDLPSIIRSRLCSQRHERMLVAEQCVVVLVSLVFQGRTHPQDSPEAQRFKTQSRNGELSRRYKTCFWKKARVACLSEDFSIA